MGGILAEFNRVLSGARGWVFWAMGLAVSLSFSARPGSEPVVEDELYWIGSAYYHHLAFELRDFSSPDWRLLPARENPPVAKYVIGASLALSGQAVESLDLLGGFYLLFANVPGAWGEQADRAKRAAVVSRMSPEAMRIIRESGQVEIPETWLRPARLAMVWCVSAASLCLFLLARSLAGGLPALVISIALPLHPIASEAMNHALADAPALLLSAAAGLALAACLRSLRRGTSLRGLFLPSLCSGALAGLACAAKMNSLVMVVLAACGFGLSFPGLLRASVSVQRISTVALIFAASAGSAFLASNPAFYGDWWSGVWATFAEHRRTAEIQAEFLSGRLDGVWDRLGAVGLLVGFSRWSWVPLLACAVAVGLAGKSRHRFVAGWWLVAWLAVSFWIPFLRLRYAAPVLLPTLLLLASAAELAALRFRERPG